VEKGRGREEPSLKKGTCDESLGPRRVQFTVGQGGGKKANVFLKRERGGRTNQNHISGKKTSEISHKIFRKTAMPWPEKLRGGEGQMHVARKKEKRAFWEIKIQDQCKSNCDQKRGDIEKKGKKRSGSEGFVDFEEKRKNTAGQWGNALGGNRVFQKGSAEGGNFPRRDDASDRRRVRSTRAKGERKRDQSPARTNGAERRKERLLNSAEKNKKQTIRPKERCRS